MIGWKTACAFESTDSNQPVAETASDLLQKYEEISALLSQEGLSTESLLLAKSKYEELLHKLDSSYVVNNDLKRTLLQDLVAVSKTLEDTTAALEYTFQLVEAYPNDITVLEGAISLCIAKDMCCVARELLRSYRMHVHASPATFATLYRDIEEQELISPSCIRPQPLITSVVSLDHAVLEEVSTHLLRMCTSTIPQAIQIIAPSPPIVSSEEEEGCNKRKSQSVERQTRRRREPPAPNDSSESYPEHIRRKIHTFLCGVHAHFDIPFERVSQSSPVRKGSMKFFAEVASRCPICATMTSSMTQPLHAEIVLQKHIQCVAEAVNTSTACCPDHQCVCGLTVAAEIVYLTSFYNNNLSELFSLFTENEILLLAECCLDILMTPPNQQYHTNTDEMISNMQFLMSYDYVMRRVVLFACERKIWLNRSDAEVIRWKWVLIHILHYLNPVYSGINAALDLLRELRTLLNVTNTSIALPHITLSSGGGNEICVLSVDDLMSKWTCDVFGLYNKRFSTAPIDLHQWAVDMLQTIAPDNTHVVSYLELQQIQQYTNSDATIRVLRSRYECCLCDKNPYIPGVSEVLLLASTALETKDVASWAKSIRYLLPMIIVLPRSEDIEKYESYLKVVVAQYNTVKNMTSEIPIDIIVSHFEDMILETLYRMVDVIRLGESIKSYIDLLLQYITGVWHDYVLQAMTTASLYAVAHCVHRLLLLKDHVLYDSTLSFLLNLMRSSIVVGNVTKICDFLTTYHYVLSTCSELFLAHFNCLDQESGHATIYTTLKCIIHLVTNIYNHTAVDDVDENLLSLALDVIDSCYTIITTKAMYMLDNGDFSLQLAKDLSRYISLKDAKHPNGTITRIPQLTEDNCILTLISILGQLYYDIYCYPACLSQCKNSENSLSHPIENEDVATLYSFAKACDFDIGVPKSDIRLALNMLYNKTFLQLPHSQNMHCLKKYICGAGDDCINTIDQMKSVLQDSDVDTLLMRREFYDDLWTTTLIVQSPSTITTDALTEFEAVLEYLTITIEAEAKHIEDIKLLHTWISVSPDKVELWCYLVKSLWSLCSVVVRELVNELHPVQALPIVWGVSSMRDMQYYVVSGSLRKVAEEYMVALDQSVILESIAQHVLRNEAADRKNERKAFINQFTDILPTVKLSAVAIASLLAKVTIISTIVDRTLQMVHYLRPTITSNDFFTSIESSVLGYYSLAQLSEPESNNNRSMKMKALDCAQQGFDNFVVTKAVCSSDRFFTCFMCGLLTWQVHRQGAAALEYMHAAYEEVSHAVQTDKLDKRYRAAVMAMLQTIRLEIVTDFLRDPTIMVSDTLRYVLEKCHRSIDEPFDCSTLCSCETIVCSCSAWIWSVVCDAVIRLAVCRQWDIYDVHSILSYCNFTIAMHESCISVPETVQTHLMSEINSSISTSIAVCEMYKIFNKRRPQIAAIWTYESSVTFDKLLESVEFNRLREKCIDIYWKLIHICQDFPKSIEMLQLCVSANNKRYVNAAIAWALRVSTEQFHALVRKLIVEPEQKMKMIVDILNLHWQMSSKQYSSCRLLLQAVAIDLYAEALPGQENITFDDVQKWYKEKTSMTGVKRSSLTQENADTAKTISILGVSDDRVQDLADL